MLFNVPHKQDGLPSFSELWKELPLTYLPGGIIVIVILALSGMHFNHLFIWMDPEVVAHDKLIAGKVGFLNVPFLLRAYLSIWVDFISLFFKKIFSCARSSNDISNHKKNFRISAAFLVFLLLQNP